MKIVLVEDSIFYAEQLSSLLAKHPELQVVYQASDEDEAVSNIKQHQPDVVILDLSFKNGSGLGVLRRIRSEGCEAQVFVLTNQSNEVVRHLCLEAGAINVFDKSSEAMDCIQSILHLIPEQENAETVRLVKLNEMQLLWGQAVDELDRITNLAALLLKMPIATISLVDEKRLWNVSRYGTDLKETSRFNSFSAITILGPEILEINNAQNDPRFSDSPLVCGEAAVSYYAGAPLILPTGQSIGVLCVMDSVPHRLSNEEKKVLSMLGKNAVTSIMQHGRMRFLEQELACMSERMNNISNSLSKDALTSLPNEVIFKDRLGQQIRNASRTKTGLATIYLDLIDFKSINQRFGHDEGDSYLVAISQRVSNVLRPIDTVTRLSGNKFAFIFPDVKHDAEALLIANKIRNAVRSPCPTTKAAHYIDCCIGISMYPQHGNTVEDLTHHANTSLQVAKCKSIANNRLDDIAYIVFYDQKFIDEKLLYANLDAEFCAALRNHEFILYCQPQVDLENFSLIGLEFLVRWKHPRLGILSPDYFMPFAEQSGLVVELTDQVLDTAIKQLSSWLKTGLQIPRVSVNISGKDVRPGLSARIRQVLEKYQVSAELLEIEITETEITTNGKDALEELRLLKDLKISIAIDDFGTGFSSLSRIQALPISCIKIDRSFTDKVEHSPSSQNISKAIISMAKALELRTIVEGIETQQQHQFFKKLGVTAGQGYYYSKPMEANRIEDWMSNNITLIS